MKNNPLISIFCSVYKGEKYIEDYLQDIAIQTIFPKCELILVNGNSPEGEEKYILEFAKKHSNVQYIKLDEDPGLYACWNIAIKKASGKYLNNANLDDRKHYCALEEQVKFLEDNAEIDLVYTDSLITKEPSKSFEDSMPVSRYDFPDFSIEKLLIYNMPHQSPVYRATLHEKFGYFDEKYKSAADGEFWLRCATKGAKMKKLNKVLGLYYFNPEGVSTDKKNQQWKQEEELEIKEKYAKLNNYNGPLHGSLSDISGL